MNRKNKIRRTHYLIDPRLQFGLIIRLLVLMVLFALFMLLEAAMAFWPVVSHYVPDVLIPSALRHILFRLAWFSLPIAFVIAVIVVVLTHRIAGPLFRIERVLDALIQGNETEPVHLRKNDELKGLAHRINALIPLVQGNRKPPAKPCNPSKPDRPA